MILHPSASITIGMLLPSWARELERYDADDLMQLRILPRDQNNKHWFKEGYLRENRLLQPLDVGMFFYTFVEFVSAEPAESDHGVGIRYDTTSRLVFLKDQPLITEDSIYNPSNWR